MRRRNLIYAIIVLISITLFSACQTYDDLYGGGSNDKKDKDQCKAAAALYLNCVNMNSGGYSSACSSSYLVTVAACGYGGGGGAGGGGGGY